MRCWFPRLRENREAEAKSNAEAKVHVPYGAKVKKKILGLLTILSLVSNVTLPQHQVPQDETYTDGLIHRFEEINEHYNNTVNEMHLFSFVSDISTNEVFTYHKAMKQND